MIYKKILCFGASPEDNIKLDEIEFLSTDFVIAIDGGISKLHASGRKPNIFFGDCDSCTYDENLWLKKQTFNVNIYPKKKEKSDFELASDYILENWKNPLPINLYGMMRGRTDHFLFNIKIALKMALKGFEVNFISEKERLIVSNGPSSIILNASEKKLVSLFSLTDKVDGIITENLEYPLVNETLLKESTRGLSNVAKAEYVKITHKNGVLVILLIGGTDENIY
ncbi:MAG: thiamine diphosphokinase [Caldisericia bacterium]|nr:thiamine diphosphokinase [Caldisericia bacterium]